MVQRSFTHLSRLPTAQKSHFLRHLKQLSTDDRLARVSYLLRCLPPEQFKPCLDAVFKTQFDEDELYEIALALAQDLPSKTLPMKVLSRTKTEHHIWFYVFEKLVAGNRYVARARWHDPLKGLTEDQVNVMVKAASKPVLAFCAWYIEHHANPAYYAPLVWRKLHLQ